MSPARDREALDQAIVRGSELLKQNKLDQAIRAFHAALEIEHDNAKVLALLGLAHFRAGQFSEARPIYEELVDRAPTDASHRLNLGLVYLKMGDGERAIHALEASRALDPSQGRAVSYLGLAYARAGRYAEAYRSFLLAGQNELASEIEINLTTTERDGINAQLGRTPPPLGPHERPTPPSQVAIQSHTPTMPMPTMATPPALPTTQPMPTPLTPQTPTQPIPVAVSASLAAAADPTPQPSPIPRTPPPAPRSPTPPGVPRMRTPSPAPPSSAVSIQPRAKTPSPSPGPSGRAITQNIVSRAALEDSGRILAGDARAKPPSSPPTSRNRTPTVPVALSAPEITVIHDAQTTPPQPTPNLVAAFARTQAEQSAAPQPLRMTESQQFVLPNRDPAAPEPQRPADGHTMVSMAVAAAAPTTPAPVRTPAGGIPPRPLSELATEELIRPEDGADVFEIGANGALIIRVTNRVLTRLDGVHVTGGDLAFEVATRRSRGHQTDERFDYGASPVHAVSGTGYLIAVPGKHAFAAVMLDDDILYLREDLVFAFESTLRWENGNVPGLRGRLPVVQFRGDGALVVRIARPLVRVKLSPQGVVFVDADRLAGWIGRVIPRAVVPPSGSPMGAMCIECSGEGVVLVEPMDEAKKPEPVPAPAPAPAPAPEAPQTSDEDRSSAALLDELGRLDD